jgi:allantoicase
MGGKVLAVSNEWFAPAINLLQPQAPIYSEKQVFTGQWMDGWETRRHNRRPFDYAIIRLGVSAGVVEGVEIDTAFFKGNEAPAISIEGLFSSDDESVISTEDAQGKWETIIGKVHCRPSHRHAWKLNQPTLKAYTHVRLNMYPDGGIARFRLYGKAQPVFPDSETVFDLAAAQNGGIVVSWSDQEFGTLASNLLLPGRGPDMADGWETARSRSENHVDWAIIKLGAPGKVRSLLLDTAHFRGNYPDQAHISGITYHGDDIPDINDKGWCDLISMVDCEADKEHAFESLIQDTVFTHVKLSIYPDGGVKRLRVFGVRVAQ